MKRVREVTRGTPKRKAIPANTATPATVTIATAYPLLIRARRWSKTTGGFKINARNAATTTRRIVARSFSRTMTATIVPRITASIVRMARRGTRFASARSNRRSRRVRAGSGCITPAWQVRTQRSCKHGGVTAQGQAPPRHKYRLRRDVKWGITAFVVVLVAEYLVVPELAGARKSLNALKRVNVGFL